MSQSIDESRQARVKEIRRKIIGKGIMDYLGASSENDIHLKYEKEGF
jgi:hypothetical protein